MYFKPNHTNAFFLTCLFLLCLSKAHTQTAISSATFGMMEARWLGPGTMSGRITDIKGVNADGRTLYIGTAGGGIWKTTNAGASFKPIFDKYCQSIGALAIDQKNPKVVYCGTGESNMRNSVSIGNGLYKSNDAGDNWVKIGLENTEHISKIAIDPNNTDIVYVAAPGPLWSDSPNRGLYKTTDGGKTWNKILYINEKTGCADIELDPSNPETVYASTWEFRRTPYSFNSGGNGSGFYKSTDGGKNWKEITKGLPPKPFGRIAFALAPSDPKNLLAIVESNNTGLFLSADGGENWKQQSATLNVTARPFYFSTIEVDPVDPKRVYRPGFGFSYSSDGGLSFADASNEGGWVHSDHHALWINPANTSQMYLGTDGGVYLSLDRGATWRFIDNLPVGQFYHVAYDKQKPYRIYGGLQDNGSWVAPSALPGGVGNGDWKAVYGGDGFWTVPDGTDPNIVYAESQGGNAGRIDLRTFQSVTIKPQSEGDEKLRWNWNTPIVTGAKNPRNLYMGAQYLYKSTDKGTNWTRISPDLTTNDKKKQAQEESGGLTADNTSAENHTTIFTIAESPIDEKMIWTGTDDGNLQVTIDGGKTWSNLAKAYAAAGIPAQTWVSSIEPSSFDKNIVFATFDNHMYGDHKTYAARSIDGGKTWKAFASKDFTGFAHKIKQDPKNKDLLFLGTEMGLFASTNGGADWFRMKNKIPEYALVRDIQIHPVTNDLILATHGRGIIVVDDISPIRQLTAEVADKDVYLLPMKEVPLSTGLGGGGFPPTGGWNSGLAAQLPAIQYYLKDRPNSGDLKIEILDSKGSLVQSLTPGKRKGINKVYWNLRGTPPKVANGGTKMDAAGFSAPMVLPGVYTVKMKVGEQEYTQTINVVHDTTNKSFSLAERQAQYKAATAALKLYTELTDKIEEVNKQQADLKLWISRTQNPESKKIMQSYNDSLEVLRSTMLATKQKSIFADEEQLRERVSELYSTIVNQEAKPSNLQVARLTVLEKQKESAIQKQEALKKKYDAPVKAIVQKEGLDVRVF
ncbi:MAG: glycosyl hydrolase [Flaviaesturariibacter sp.]|nr:glycosyl hydrolase [Flaviaesturariibacter sp.]